MSLPMQHIIQHLFNTASLSGVPREQLEELVEEYPSFGVARYLLSRKLQADGDEHFSAETLKTNLYFSNPYWLQWLLKNNGDGVTEVEERIRRNDVQEDTPPGEESANWSDKPTNGGDLSGGDDKRTDEWENPAAEAPIPSEVIEPVAHERLYGSAEEARAAATEETRVHEDAAMRTGEGMEEFVKEEASTDHRETAVTGEPGTGADEHATQQPWINPDETAATRESGAESEADAAFEGSETVPEVSKEWRRTESEEVLGPDAPSAADQLLQSIAALRLSHQQAVEEAGPAPEEPAPAMSIVATALEQADDQSVDNNNIEDSDGTPPLPEDSEESAGAVLAAAGYPGAHGQDTIREDHTPTDAPPAASMQGIAGNLAGQPGLTPIVEPIVAFEPFHTIDYFASQGIRLTLDENPSDKLGKQLKSFTDWLKVMRRLPQQNNQIVPDIAAEHQVRAIAAHSIEGKEVLTETMADVLVKQGMREKAMDVYLKLSLLNPDKSAYFANKIEELKID